MPEYKLTYFDIRGRAEPIRLALAIGGIPFEDERIKRESWMEMKPTTPYGSLPLMSIDGETAAQSAAILRYAGKMAGLYPDDPLKALKVDEIVDTMADLNNCAYRYRGDDKERMKEERTKFVEEDVPRFFGGALKRMDEGEWAVGGELSIADLLVFHAVTNFQCGMLDFVPRDLAEGYERAMVIYHKVKELPEVAAWYEKHPVVEF